MTRVVLVDTDVMVGFLRGRDLAVAFIRHCADRLALSSIVVAELYAGVKGEAELKALDSLVSHVRVIPVTPEIARTAGLIKRDFGKSHGVGLADAILGATAHVENAELSTLNVKHYPMVAGLKPAYREE